MRAGLALAVSLTREWWVGDDKRKQNREQNSARAEGGRNQRNLPAVFLTFQVGPGQVCISRWACSKCLAKTCMYASV